MTSPLRFPLPVCTILFQGFVCCQTSQEWRSEEASCSPSSASLHQVNLQIVEGYKLHRYWDTICMILSAQWWTRWSCVNLGMGPCHPSFHCQVFFHLFFYFFFLTLPIVMFRPAGVFAKVNRIVFTQQGNKFGVCDGDGNTALWQVNIFALI